MTIQTAITEFLEISSARLASNSIRIYRNNLLKFSRYAGKNRLLSEVNNKVVDLFLSDCKDKYSLKTCENVANSLKTFFKHWFSQRETQVAWELIRGPRVPERYPHFISLEDFEFIDEYLSGEEYNQLTLRLIVNLLWCTGMRIGELLSLNVDQIETDKNYTHVTTKKTGRLRIIMWNKNCHDLLIKYLGVRLCLNQEKPLFQTPHGKGKKRGRLTSRTVQRWLRKVGKELGVKCNPHSFRHGRCHYIITNGGTRHDVQTIVGHSSIESSEIYTRLNPREQRRIQEKHLPPNRVNNAKVLVTPYYSA